MTAAQVDAHARALTRELLNRAGEDLVRVVESRQDVPPVVNGTEWYRLRHGQAGIGLIVKAARRLGLSVEIRFGQAEKMEGV